MAGRPPAEVDVDATLVRALIAAQHPDLADEPLTPLDAGWDNVMFRLGTTMTVRVPRRAVAVELLRNEQRWLPVLAPRLPIAIPAPLRIGRANADYPWPWSILPWFEGQGADLVPIEHGETRRFADFLLALHVAAPDDAPHNPVRGVPLAARQDMIESRLATVRAATDLITPAIERAWQRALAAPQADEARWMHGDLHAQNILVADGIVQAVIDWGDIAAGDAATDLHAVWSAFEAQRDRQRIFDHYAPDPASYERAIGWAIAMGCFLVDAGRVNSPRHAEQGAALLRRLAADL